MKKLLSLVLALVMLFSLAACGTDAGQTSAPPADDSQPPATATPAPEPVSDEPQYGGTATIYYPKFYNFFDPCMMDEYQFAFWYETLWIIDWGLNDPATYNFGPGQTPLEYMAGQLATDTGVFDEAAGTLTVTLRDGVFFHEGEPYNGRQLTANDVVWSYSRLLGINGYEKVESEFDWAGNLSMIAGIEAKDDSTVVFTFAEGRANTVALTALVNAKVNIGGPEWDTLTAEQKSDWHYAKGTGAYVLTDYVADNSMTFTANENYYGVDERHPENKLPYIETVKLIYISDSSQILAQAQAGKLDWFGENGKDVLNLDQIQQLTTADVGTVYPFAAGSPSSIALKVQQKPFDDIRVRQAMQLAIDLEAINSYLGDDSAPIVPGLWSTALSWSTVDEWPEDLTAQFTTSTADLAANQEKARQLLADAGYADGFEFEVELDPIANLELFQVAAQYLDMIGITMKISVAAEMMEAVQHSQDYTDPRQSAGFGGGFGEYMMAAMMTGDGPMPNAFGHTDADYLKKIADLGMMTSVAEQDALARELDQYFPAQHWAILVAGVQPNYDFMGDRIQGYSGEKIYYKGNMRTYWSRLWIAE